MINYLGMLGISISEKILLKENLFLIGLAVIWIIVAIIQDFRKREVENWWSFSLIAFVLAYRAFLSIENWNYLYFVWGLIGLAIGFILMNLFYYARIFAGGDAKLLMALSTILPFGMHWQTNLIILVLFLFLFILSGAVYGFIYSLFLIFLRFTEFRVEFSKQFEKNKRLIYLVCSFGMLLLIITLILDFYLVTSLVLILLLFPFLLIYSLAIEEVNMKKLVSVKELTVGDWIVNPIKAKNKIIKPYWEGLSEEELKFIQKHYKKKVLVRYGIPFTPSFLIAFVLLVLYFDFFPYLF